MIASTALQFEAALEIPAEVWLNLQAQFDLASARQEARRAPRAPKAKAEAEAERAHGGGFQPSQAREDEVRQGCEGGGFTQTLSRLVTDSSATHNSSIKIKSLDGDQP